MSIQIGKQYFEGYEEKFVPKTNGKGYKKVRVYLGDSYRLEGTDQQWVIRKLTLSGCILAYFVLMLWCGSLPALANVSAYVMLPFAIGLIAGGYCAIGVFNAVVASRNMTVYDHNEQHKQLKNGSLAAACAMTACTASNVVCLILWGINGLIPEGMLPRELVVLFSNMICAILMAYIYLLEKKSVYTVIPGKRSNQSDGWSEA